jgi:hypothetical protein
MEAVKTAELLSRERRTESQKRHAKNATVRSGLANAKAETGRIHKIIDGKIIKPPTLIRKTLFNREIY